MRFGFHPLNDLNSPKQMLDESLLAEETGFSDIYFADHFHPWSSLASGTSFAWTLIASAAERTKNVRLGTAVTCPTIRYNPAIVAQAFATLGATYEGRIFLGVGTGEALNEVPVGYEWPKGRQRLELLEESIEIIRKLWTGNYVSYNGKHFRLSEAKLFTIPTNPLPIYVSAFGPKAAGLAGRLGDGWITGNLPEEYLREVMIPRFEEGLKRSSVKRPAEKIAEILLSYNQDLERAIDATLPIAGTLSPDVFKNNIIDPREIAERTTLLDRKMIAERFLATNDLEKIVSVIEKFEKLGFDCVELASLSPDNGKFMETFSREVMPRFSKN